MLNSQPTTPAATATPSESNLWVCRCGKTGLPEGMFNLPCDTESVSVESITVLCRKCAIKASRNSKPGTRGSGVYPLMLTLKSMVAEQAAVNEERASEAVLRLVEAEEAKRQTAEEQEVRAYARAYAQGDKSVSPPQSLKSGEHDLCGLPEDVPCCQHEGAIVDRFIMIMVKGEMVGICHGGAVACLKELTSGDLGDNRHKLRVSNYAKARILAEVAVYARRYAEAPTDDDMYPSPQYADGDAHFCGLPESVHCCNHETVVNRYLVVNGVMVGICGLAVGVFTALLKSGEFPDCQRLKTGDYETASRVVANWFNSPPARQDHSEEPWRSPLGNKTEPRTAQEEAEHRARQHQISTAGPAKGPSNEISLHKTGGKKHGKGGQGGNHGRRQH